MRGRKLLSAILLVLIIPSVEAVVNGRAKAGERSGASATPTLHFLDAKEAKAAIVDD